MLSQAWNSGKPEIARKFNFDKGEPRKTSNFYYKYFKIRDKLFRAHEMTDTVIRHLIDTENNLNVQKTFTRRPGGFLNVQSTSCVLWVKL